MNIKSENHLENQEAIMGKIALAILNANKQAKIWGITSSGVFINLGQSIIFLTNSEHLGPVNIISHQPIPTQWKKDDDLNITVEDELIFFEHEKSPLSLKIKEIWQSATRPILNISINEQQRRMMASAKQLSLLKNDQGFAPLLLPFLADTLLLETDDSWLFSSWNTITLLKIALYQNDDETFLSMANLLVGSGRGLTPSGDDLITGFTIMRRRWFRQFDWISEAENQLLSTFKEKTTAVSSTLYDCALQGEADARIHEMSDALMNADIPFHDQAMQLSRWGNSSGADIFLGMLLAIRCFQMNQ